MSASLMQQPNHIFPRCLFPPPPSSRGRREQGAGGRRASGGARAKMETSSGLTRDMSRSDRQNSAEAAVHRLAKLGPWPSRRPRLEPPAVPCDPRSRGAVLLLRRAASGSPVPSRSFSATATCCYVGRRHTTPTASRFLGSAARSCAHSSRCQYGRPNTNDDAACGACQVPSPFPCAMVRAVIWSTARHGKPRAWGHLHRGEGGAHKFAGTCEIVEPKCPGLVRAWCKLGVFLSVYVIADLRVLMSSIPLRNTPRWAKSKHRACSSEGKQIGRAHV